MMMIIEKKEDLIDYIKRIFLLYCPYVEDRMGILDNPKPPEIDIEINIYNNESIIRFMSGTPISKKSTSEQAKISYSISFKEITAIIDFILIDHEIMKDINPYGKTISLKFAINWTEKNIKGMNCDDIGLKLSFENQKVKNQYLSLLYQTYYTHFEQNPTFKKRKEEYMNNIKQFYFNTLDKKDLITFLNRMDENELIELLCYLDNDIFMKYIANNKEQQKSRLLSRKENDMI